MANSVLPVLTESVMTTLAVAAHGSWKTLKSTVRRSVGNGSSHTVAGLPRTKTTDNLRGNFFHKTWLPRNTTRVSNFLIENNVV